MQPQPPVSAADQPQPGPPQAPQQPEDGGLPAAVRALFQSVMPQLLAHRLSPLAACNATVSTLCGCRRHCCAAKPAFYQELGYQANSSILRCQAGQAAVRNIQRATAWGRGDSCCGWQHSCCCCHANLNRCAQHAAWQYRWLPSSRGCQPGCRCCRWVRRARRRRWRRIVHPPPASAPWRCSSPSTPTCCTAQPVSWTSRWGPHPAAKA